MDGKGGVLSVRAAGANVHDAKLLAETIAAMIVGAGPNPRKARSTCAWKKGYDNPSGRAAAEGEGYVAHVRRIGEEKLDEKNHRRSQPGGGSPSVPGPR